MGYTTVKFLGESFEISETIKEYLNYEKDFTPYINRLISDVTKIIDNHSISKPSDVIGNRINNDFSKYYKLMDSFTDGLVKKLISYEIYDVTANDLNNNGSHKNMIVNLSAKVTMKATEEGQTFLQMKQMGMANAYNYASSQITGTGFGIITNSFSSLMIYSAIEMHSLLSQAKKADEEYSRAVQNITRKASDGFERMCKDILVNEYYPVIYAIFADFTNHVTSSFLAQLTLHNKFDFESIAAYNMNKANEMLDNIQSAPNKKAFLQQVFLKCPFNPSVYKKCFELGYMDKDTFKTAVYFDLGDEYKDDIENQCKRNYDDINAFTQSLELYAICNNVDEATALKQLYSDKIKETQTKYQYIISALTSIDGLKTWIKTNLTQSADVLCGYSDKIIQEKIDNALKMLLSERLFDIFKTYNSVDVFKIPYSDNDKSLSEINSILKTELFNSIFEFIPKLKENREIVLSEYKTLKQEYDNKKSENENAHNALISQKKQIDTEIASLGFFAFKKKKELNIQKSEITNKIAVLLKELNELDDIKNECEAKLKQADKIS